MYEEDHEQIVDLIPEFALGALPMDEAATVKQHLATCAACRHELAIYESVVDALPLAAPTMYPAPKLRAQLLEQIRESPPPETSITTAPSAWQSVTTRIQNFLNGPRRQLVLVIAIIAILAGAVYVWQQNRTAPLDPYELTATKAAPDSQGLISVSANGRDATLTVSGLPPLSPDEQYQLWLIEDGQRGSGAVFSVAEDSSATVPVESERPLAEYGAFGITIEPAGAVPDLRASRS